MIRPNHAGGIGEVFERASEKSDTSYHRREVSTFDNEPMRDFSDKAQRDSFAKDIQAAKIHDVQFISAEQAKKLIGIAEDSFEYWRSTAVYQRSAKLLRAAEIMRKQRDYLAGVIIKEAGKVWREADADVCEAIDFLVFYAKCAIDMSLPEKVGHCAGELNECWVEPRGVTAVISPWNFPLAIATGMVSAALVTGNPVILKPAEQTTYIAKLLVDILYQAGVPKQVMLLAPGQGETVGATLVRDPRVVTLAFTGSKDVGLDIIKAAHDTQPSQHMVKRVVCEMGGKNAIIIDDSADLDQAVIGVRASAFSFSGQKCSACSRCLVHKDIYDLFVKRLVAATKTLIVGDPMDPATDVGPLIDQEAAQKVRQYIHIGQQKGQLAIGGHINEQLEQQVGKPFVLPHIFTGISQADRLANEEIFGPVLSIIQVNDFEEALKLANQTDYKLTGGVFTRKPSHLKLAKEQFRVGNLYLNRSITGALVARQPFGGFGLSGVGEKAGGKHYLRQFTVPRVCTENTMRRGFSPDLLD